MGQRKRGFYFASLLNGDRVSSIVALFVQEFAMTDINIPDNLSSWIKDHIKLQLIDGEASHLRGSAAGGGRGLLRTLLLTTVGRKSGNRLVITLIYQPTSDGGFCIIASKEGVLAHPAW